jgi:hypothetical protein
VLESIGWVAGVIVNKTTGLLIDGHLRVEEAIAQGQPTVPVRYVELTADEERVMLALFDRLGAMASIDGDALQNLVGQIEWQHETLSKAMEEFADEAISSASPLAADSPRLAASNACVTVGTYRTLVAREVYLTWLDRLRMEVGFDQEAIETEILRRLGL